MDEQELQRIHRLSIRHREMVRQATHAGCFYCLKIFPTSEIQETTDDGQTALCPKCGLDAVLPGTPELGHPLTKALLIEECKWAFGMAIYENGQLIWKPEESENPTI